MGELAEMLDVSPRSVTGLVDNLERDGLVKALWDDRRSALRLCRNNRAGPRARQGALA